MFWMIALWLAAQLPLGVALGRASAGVSSRSPTTESKDGAGRRLQRRRTAQAARRESGLRAAPAA